MRIGIATLKDDKFHLKYNYSYTRRCNCHPETCCCGGLDIIWDTHEIEVLNPEGLIEGNKYDFELRKVKYNYKGSDVTAEKVYILN